MKVSDYKEIFREENDCRGPAKSKARAEKMRCVKLPSTYHDENSRADDDRRLTPFLAIVCEETDTAYVVFDFARLFIMNVVTNSRPWTQEDLTPGSEVCGYSSVRKDTYEDFAAVVGDMGYREEWPGLDVRACRCDPRHA